MLFFNYALFNFHSFLFFFNDTIKNFFNQNMSQTKLLPICINWIFNQERNFHNLSWYSSKVLLLMMMMHLSGKKINQKPKPMALPIEHKNIDWRRSSKLSTKKLILYLEKPLCFNFLHSYGGWKLHHKFFIIIIILF